MLLLMLTQFGAQYTCIKLSLIKVDVIYTLLQYKNNCMIV